MNNKYLYKFKSGKEKKFYLKLRFCKNDRATELQ